MTKAKSLFSQTVIRDNKNAVITVGEKNLVSVSQKLTEIEETSVTTESQNWQKILQEIVALQEIVRSLPDEYEEMRDQDLVPTLSRTKKEAQSLAENPKGEKKDFLEKFKTFCDLALKVADVAVKVAPFVVTIAELAGVPVP